VEPPINPDQQGTRERKSRAPRHSRRMRYTKRRTEGQRQSHQSVGEEVLLWTSVLIEGNCSFVRYKKELEDALDRERALEEAKAQLDLDWQKKFEQNQRQEYHKSEDLIEKISSAHEQVFFSLFFPTNSNHSLSSQSIAQVKKLENDLRFKDDLLKAYTNQYKSVSDMLAQFQDTISLLK
jgi:hypothetical protein